MYKKDFSLFKQPGKQNYTYLDSAATTLKPHVVIDAITQAYEQLAGSARRGLYEGSEEATQSLEQVRQSIAQFLGVESKTIIFTKNTTDSINLVALSWAEHAICEGDEIVVTAREHHANFIPWQQLALRKKAKFVVIPVDAQGELVANCADYITSATKILAIGHVSNVTGVKSFYLEKVVKKAQDLKVAVCIDGAQAVSYEENFLVRLNPDFYAFSGHKMCGPYNVGVLYVASSRHKEMRPHSFGGGAVFQVTEKVTEFLSFPYCFEPGTLPVPEIIGFKTALEYVQKIKVTTIAKHSNALVKLFLDTIDRSKIIVVGNSQQIYNESHLVSFMVPGFHAHDVAAYLSSCGIAVRAGNHCAQPLHSALGYDATIRVSFYIYNTEEDVFRCIKALHNLVS